VIQSDADGSHDPGSLPDSTGSDPRRAPQTSYLAPDMWRHGGTVGWGPSRKLMSRGGSLFAGALLRLPIQDLTGGFKSWRSSCLEALDFDRIGAGGYVFQIEMTYRAHLSGGAGL